MVMNVLNQLFIATALSVTGVASANSPTELNTGNLPSTQNSQTSGQAIQSVIYVPESLKQSYPFLRDTGPASPFHKFAPGTTIFLNPGDVKLRSNDPLKDVLNASLPEGSPYKELLYKIIKNDRNAIDSVTNPEIASPEAIIRPGLKDKNGKQLQIILIRPIEDYSNKSRSSTDFFGHFTGVGDTYRVHRQSDNMSLMAAVILHEFGHAKDHKYAIPNAYDRRNFMATLQGELVADCAAHEGAQTKGIGDVLGITHQTMQEFGLGRSISMFLKTSDSHATAVHDLRSNGCKADFSYAGLDNVRDDLGKLKSEIYLRVGQHFLPEMLNALVNGKNNIPADVNPEHRKIFENYASNRIKISDLGETLKFYKERSSITSLLGKQIADSDPAIVYGVVKKILATPEENIKLSEAQKRFAQNFIEACDKLYPDLKAAPLVGLGSQMSAYSSETRQAIIQGYIDRLAPQAPLPSQPIVSPALR